MTGTERKMSRRRHRCGWKAVCVTLLGLMSGAAGCQSTGDSAARAVLDPVAAVTRDGSSPSAAPAAHPPGATAADMSLSTQARGTSPEAPASVDSAVKQASYNGDPDRSAPEDGEAARLAGVPAQLPVGIPTAAPPADKPADREKDKKRDRWTSDRDKPYEVERLFPSPMKGLDTPVIPAPERVRPLTLGASLALAGVENPVIGMAEQAIQVSRADQLQARVLLLPNVNVGSSYHLHNGPLQASFGGIRKVDRDNVLYGLGVNTVAAETIKIPGLLISTHLGNALYEPLIARQVVENRRFTFAATRNQVLLDVSTAYLELLGAEGHLAVIRQSEADFEEVLRLTKNFAQTGQGRQGDADRAQADLLALQYKEQRAQERVAVASAELARLLNQDPATRLQTGDVPIQVVQFVDPNEPLPKLLEIASRNRPEVMAAAANISASRIRVRQEKTRPFYPTLVMGFSADDFGGGSVASTNGNAPNPHGSPSPGGAPSAETGGRTVPSFGRITGRTDVDVLALWTLQNMGFGNIAHIRDRRAEMRVAEAERVRILNMVVREVSESYNLSAAHWRGVEIERRGVQEATEGFQRDLNRIRGGVGFPIEVLNNAKKLLDRRQRLLDELISFDQSQFKLFVSMGQPPTMVVDEDKPVP
jgi:outer membrane protein TolC